MAVGATRAGESIRIVMRPAPICFSKKRCAMGTKDSVDEECRRCCDATSRTGGRSPAFGAPIYLFMAILSRFVSHVYAGGGDSAYITSGSRPQFRAPGPGPGSWSPLGCCCYCQRSHCRDYSSVLLLLLLLQRQSRGGLPRSPGAAPGREAPEMLRPSLKRRW